MNRILTSIKTSLAHLFLMVFILFGMSLLMQDPLENKPNSLFIQANPIGFPGTNMQNNDIEPEIPNDIPTHIARKK